ncbi:ribonuclease H family protein [Lactiplantibacillus daowaiensis]|uniref:ribonuclease H n=1 Tax=Lactiplantibacillus daowaiensis TaxID=2559918 RepID=A0ABW1S2U0_9LACO
MAKTKFYAVRKGYHPGIYTTWADCQKQTNGYGGAQFKSFTTRSEAEVFMQGHATASKPAKKAAQTSVPVGKADITVYTDGGNRNTGNVQGGQVKTTDKSAWAYQIELPDQTLTGTSGEWGATNNRMEVMALIQALDRLTILDKTEANILVITDSKYVLNPIQQHWLSGWRKRGWRRSNGELINAELWKIVDQQLKNFSHLDFHWVKGHATTNGNVTVDHLLNQTMDQMTPGKPIPEHHATAKTPTRAPKTAQGDLFKAAPVTTTKVTAKPKTPLQSATTPAPKSATPKQPDPAGHLANDQQKAHSISAMESIVNDWKNHN